MQVTPLTQHTTITQTFPADKRMDERLKATALLSYVGCTTIVGHCSKPNQICPYEVTLAVTLCS